MTQRRWGQTSRAKAAGFTLWEVLIALTLIAIMTAMLYPGLSSELNFSRRETTQAKLTELQKALIDAYTNNAWMIDSQSGSEIQFSSSPSRVLKTGNAANPQTRTNVQSGFETMSEYAGKSAPDLALDGFNAPWKVFVSKRLSKQWRGTTIYYHVVALVSNNGRGLHGSGQTLNAATSFNAKTGQLKLGGHDQGIVVSGYPIEVKLARRTLKKMQSVASEYEQYFTARYLANSSRDPTLDYFTSSSSSSCASSYYDSSNPVKSTYAVRNSNPSWRFRSPTGGTDTDYWVMSKGTTLSPLAQALGISPQSTKDAWGNPMGYLNNTGGIPDVRTPCSFSASMQSPPWTAQIAAWFPGNVLFTISAVGST